MEARLGVALGGRKNGGGQLEPESASADADGESVAPVADRRPTENGAEDAGPRPALLEGEGAPNAWPDESAESAMMSELRGRGEKPGSVPAIEVVAEIDPKNLPSLDELVKRLPPEVRETLDELFRVRFVRVSRVPQKALVK